MCGCPQVEGIVQTEKREGNDDMNKHDDVGSRRGCASSFLCCCFCWSPSSPDHRSFLRVSE